jgi:gliding motility-associated lipoprotein GldH
MTWNLWQKSQKIIKKISSIESKFDFRKMKQRDRVLKSGFIILFSLFVLSSCNSNVVYNENKSVDEKAWKAEDKVHYLVQIDDTTRKYKLALNVRNTTDYPYCNVYFFMNTILPDGSITKRDTIECNLAYPDGTWKGKGRSDLRDNRFWIAKNIEFAKKGEYVFELYQATTDSTLSGIVDVGLHIEYQD